jgi:hypothetical protein
VHVDAGYVGHEQHGEVSFTRIRPTAGSNGAPAAVIAAG